MVYSYISIYKQHFTDAYNTIRQYRDNWDQSVNSALESPIRKYDRLWTPDEYTFDYVIRESDNITQDALTKMFTQMMIHRDPLSIRINIRENEYFEYSENNSSVTHRTPMPIEPEYRAVITTVQSKKILFIFKKYGIGNRLSYRMLNQIVKEYALQGYIFISLSDTNSYTEIFNHNNNQIDPSRGTNIYPLPLFFRILFGQDEFSLFEKYYMEYRQSVNAYFGLSIVKSLRPNVLFRYKKQVRDTISMFDYSETLPHFTTRELSEEQKSIIDEQFNRKGFLYALTSLLPYSKCFMTAEWLYTSLRDSCDSIDLTAISMGYFKSLEQFLYQLIGQHTSEKDGKKREYAFRDDEWLELTDDRYISKKKDMTLGGLAKFLKNRRNRDLFSSYINQNTYDVIRDVLSKVTAQRNGYFHKDNIVAWLEVERDRNITILIFYLLLGALSFSDIDREVLGVNDSFCPSEEDMVCMHINSLRINDDDPLTIPVIYFSEEAAKEDFWFPCPDKNIKYNEFGDPQHSGIFYRRMSDNESHAVYSSKAELPATIFEGTFHISKQIPISYTLSGPIKQIWGDNTYLVK